MDTELYEMDFEKGLVKIDTTGKTDLKRGQVLKWGGNMGFPSCDYVIIDTLKDFECVVYRCIKLKRSYETETEYNPQYHNIQPYSIKTREEKTNHSQYHFIEPRTLTEEEIKPLVIQAEQVKKAFEDNQKKAEIQREKDIKKGRELFNKYIPQSAKALIIAEQHINDSDIQTDYFNHKTEKTIILGFSDHTRDIFLEMRKYADRIKETEHLKTIPQENRNGEPKTEENKSYWTPKDEHREKYSMGAGYYLKIGHRDTTGWAIKKATKWREDWGEEFYISMAKKCVFQDLKSQDQEPQETNININIEDITLKRNIEKNGLELYFKSKPSESIRTLLKVNGFKWGKYNKCWYKKYYEGVEQETKDLIKSINGA